MHQAITAWSSGSWGVALALKYLAEDALPAAAKLLACFTLRFSCVANFAW